MTDATLLWDWLSFAIRWLHVITGIAWIGSSFYFIALDLGLRRDGPLPDGVGGEAWQVHGGGFYRIQKYTVAPAELPDHLTWFKWESYATWLSGAALLMVVYWMGAELFLIDHAKLDLPVWLAIVISGGSLVLGWIGYDLLCKSPLGDRPTALMLLLFVLITVIGWAYTQVFTGRAALLHLGALTATIMTANVAHIIIPNQRIVVADLKAGRVPDPKYGKIAKLRSTHNNYLTLPVIFLMVSNHYPLAFATPYNWLIASLVFLMGVSIRHYFNTRHAHAGNPVWTWGVTALLFLMIVWLSSFGAPEVSEGSTDEARLAHPAFADVRDVVETHCAMCHAREPLWDTLAAAPKGVVLTSDTLIAAHADQIYLQAGIAHAMPPGNLTYMEDQERAAIVRWYQATR